MLNNYNIWPVGIPPNFWKIYFGLVVFAATHVTFFLGLLLIFTSTFIFLILRSKPTLSAALSTVVKIYYRLQRAEVVRWWNTRGSATVKCDSEFNHLEYYDCDKSTKKHVFLFREKSRSNDLIIFKDEFDVDITDFLEPYLGPLQNFHGALLTPWDFEHEKITVFRDGERSLCKTFAKHEPMIL
jgi:hypothetical protein